MQGSGSFGYKYISVEESTAANVLYCNGTLVHLAADQIPKGFAVSYEPLCCVLGQAPAGFAMSYKSLASINIQDNSGHHPLSASKFMFPELNLVLANMPSLLLHQAFGKNYLKFCLHSIKIEDIGLYRENAIAIQGVMCSTSQCELRSTFPNLCVTNVIHIVTYYTLLVSARFIDASRYLSRDSIQFASIAIL